jgi:hypothetical protein
VVAASARSTFSLSFQYTLTTSPTGKPVSAYWMAGARMRAKLSFPKRVRSASQPFTAPGTVAASMPRCGMRVFPLARRYSAVSALGAHPDALSPYSFPVFAS